MRHSPRSEKSSEQLNWGRSPLAPWLWLIRHWVVSDDTTDVRPAEWYLWMYISNYKSMVMSVCDTVSRRLTVEVAAVLCSRRPNKPTVSQPPGVDWRKAATLSQPPGVDWRKAATLSQPPVQRPVRISCMWPKIILMDWCSPMSSDIRGHEESKTDWLNGPIRSYACTAAGRQRSTSIAATLRLRPPICRWN